MGGVVAETGTHDELMGGETYYKKLVDTQGEAALAAHSASVMSKQGSTMSFGAKNKLQDNDADKKVSEPLIVFRNVCFSYPSRPNKRILDQFKLTIHKGGTHEPSQQPLLFTVISPSHLSFSVSLLLLPFIRDACSGWNVSLSSRLL